MSCKIKMVAGFMFSQDLGQVALIRKAKPEWQAGRLNGIGGKVMPGEAFSHAMMREFLEEAGVETKRHQWRDFCSIEGDDFMVAFFAARMIGRLPELNEFADSGERIEVHQTDMITTAQINRLGLIENLPWLVALAVDVLTDGRPLYATVEYPS